MDGRILIAGMLALAASGMASRRPLKDGETWVYVTIEVTDTHGKPAGVSSAKVEAFGFPNKTRYLAGDIFTRANSDPEGTLLGKFPVDSRDELESYVVSVKQMAGYEDTQLAPRRFYRNGGGPEGYAGLGVEGKPYQLKTIAVRDPKKWRPVFCSYELLPEGLQTLLGKSNRLEFLPLKGEPVCVASNNTSGVCAGVLNKTNFEKPPVKNEVEFLLAKAALLNIYALLSATPVPIAAGPSVAREKWLDSLVEIRRIGQERIICQVEPKMFNYVRSLANESTDPFDCLHYYSASSFLHGRNMANLAPGGEEVFSVKAPDCKGNLQLTVARFSHQDAVVYFADIDIDQRRSLPHIFDALVQTATHTGTNPILIYEELGALPALQQLNYHLELKSK
jgi:hypothetical protein